MFELQRGTNPFRGIRKTFPWPDSPGDGSRVPTARLLRSAVSQSSWPRCSSRLPWRLASYGTKLGFCWKKSTASRNMNEQRALSLGGYKGQLTPNFSRFNEASTLHYITHISVFEQKGCLDWKNWLPKVEKSRKIWSWRWGKPTSVD